MKRVLTGRTGAEPGPFRPGLPNQRIAQHLRATILSLVIVSLLTPPSPEEVWKQFLTN